MSRFRWTTIHVVFLYVSGVILGGQLVDFGMNILPGEASFPAGFLGLVAAIGLPVLPAMHAYHLAGKEAD